MKTIALALGLSVMTLAGPALAEKSAADLSVRVSYSDLDLSKSDDASSMLKRLRIAVQRVCVSDQDSNLTPSDVRAARACRSQLMKASVERIGSSELTRLYEQTNARPLTVAGN